MKIEEIPSGLVINIDSQEIKNHFLELALKQIKNKKPYQHSTAYLQGFRIDIRFIETPGKEYVSKRKTMLTKAKKVVLSDFTEEFRSTGNKETQRVISQFCNVFKHWDRDRSLAYLITLSKEDALKFRGIGSKALDLFEDFLKSKDFTFASFWTGKEWI